MENLKILLVVVIFWFIFWGPHGESKEKKGDKKGGDKKGAKK